eukprot:CAMPEP_0113621982 /NCGR_PEP_ID=MMETSP0017_2-20120614/11252_1 /TAXON_ID=2856 /ORGANISM="Cylindrotheca closterium" /LENGTH=572 /DNA_ID=CAMNT_0000531777 /DNA_START=216 /DNA_END=1931 /DNA_ORIENTATION=+ /assembly_acc=CAM_ASM_000147
MKSVGSISLLQHYEVLMCRLIDYFNATVEFSKSASDSEQLWQQLRILSNDLIAVTSAPKVSFTPYIRSNIAIPTLRRLQHHLLKIFISEDDPHLTPLDSETLAGCVLSSLISSTDRLDPSVIAPMLTDEHQCSLKNICVVPPDTRVGTEISQFFTFQSIDWSSVSIDDSSWNDRIVGAQVRSAEIVWTDMAELLAKRQRKRDPEELVNLPGDKQMQHYVIQSLGMDTLSSAIRSMFFARNEEPFEPREKQTTSTYVMLGRTVTKTQTIEMEKPYRTTPSRAYVALVFCLYLSVEQEEDCMQLVSNLLPVFLELIDSPDNVFCCLGVSALRTLLNMTGKRKCWLGYEGHCIAALNSAFTTHRNGPTPTPTLILIGVVQSCLFGEIFQDAGQKRKQVTRQWLLQLRQLALGVSSGFSPWDVLVGGVIPLLFQHAKLPNADAIELGRLGLSAILPLLVSETTEKKALASLFVAMINLMAGAYPMMAHHRGKIMTHLLAATTKLKMSDDSEDCCVFALGRHTAGLGHVIVSSGGNKDAEGLLDTIERESDSYQVVLIEVAKEIREYAAELTHTLMK